MTDGKDHFFLNRPVIDESRDTGLTHLQMCLIYPLRVRTHVRVFVESQDATSSSVVRDMS